MLSANSWKPREATRRSRACAYLSNEGITGVFVDRLPPGAKCVKNDADEAALTMFMEVIWRIQQTNQHAVRASS